MLDSGGGLADALRILDQREAHVALPERPETDARGDIDERGRVEPSLPREVRWPIASCLWTATLHPVEITDEQNCGERQLHDPGAKSLE